MRAADFFAFARERHAIHLRRADGLPRSQWTRDPILQQYRFTNVFRELDRTTVWFRENVRDPLRDRPEVLLATVLFRWFNRIATGEAIFKQESLGLGGEEPGETAWDFLLRTDDVSSVRASILQYCGKGPYVTGAYIIKTPDGKNKLDGVLWCVEQFMTRRHRMPGIAGDLDWREAASLEKDACVSLEMMWTWLRQFPYMGDFMAYEVITDLRHTALLEHAPDVMTWANPGPGAMRGLNRLHGRPLGHRQPKERFILEMRNLLELSRWPDCWPQWDDANHKFVGETVFMPESRQSYPTWEMRNVEHTLCEWDKFERVRTGEGRPRQVFR